MSAQSWLEEGMPDWELVEALSDEALLEIAGDEDVNPLASCDAVGELRRRGIEPYERVQGGR